MLMSGCLVCFHFRRYFWEEIGLKVEKNDQNYVGTAALRDSGCVSDFVVINGSNSRCEGVTCYGKISILRV